MNLCTRGVNALEQGIRRLAYLTVWTLAANAQTPSHDLTEASLEELMNIKVTSVSKKEQSLVTAPVAVYVITQEEIRRSGLNSIPEILRMAPGLDVAQIHGNQWAISARGFNGQFGNKILVLIDGRSVYVESDSGVYWDEQDTLIEDIDRIEVIRGPGATLWGVNAVNGVINIITKPASATQGGLVATRSGNGDHNISEIRYGGRIGTLGSYRVYSKYSRREDFLSVRDNRRDKDWEVTRSGFRSDWKFSDQDSLTVEGDLFRGNAGVSVVVPILAEPFQQEFEGPDRTEGGNILANWIHRRSDRSTFTVKSYVDLREKKNPITDERGRTFDLDFQHAWTPSARHEIVWGLGFRRAASYFRGTPTLIFADQHNQLFSSFVQDDIHLGDRLSLAVGSKFEHNDFTGFEIQPSARVLWAFTPRMSLWAGVSRAVRIPAYFQVDSELNLAAFPTPEGLPGIARLYGNPNILSETMRAHEVGYRTELGKHFSLDWTGFYNVYQRLGTYEPGTPFVTSDPQPFHLVIPSAAANGARGESVGTEITASLDVTRQWRVSSSYSWLDLQLHLNPASHDTFSEPAEGQSPRHQIQFRSNLDFGRHVQLDANVYHVGALPALAVASYTRVDARVGWQPLAPFEVSLGGQNLQGGLHTEFISEGPFAPSRIGRTFYARAAWHF